MRRGLARGGVCRRSGEDKDNPRNDGKVTELKRCGKDWCHKLSALVPPNGRAEAYGLPCRLRLLVGCLRVSGATSVCSVRDALGDKGNAHNQGDDPEGWPFPNHVPSR
jgi:hypothetical protein